MSGADEQQRDTAGRRGWWLVGLLAVIGAAVGAFAGHRLDPDVRELVPSLAVAGFGLGGLIGLLLLAPVGLWRAWRRRAHRRAATRERAELPDGTRLWHTADPGREAESAAAAGVPRPALVDAPPEKRPEAERPDGPAPGPEQADALTSPQQPAPELEEVEDLAAEQPRPQPEQPPPPAGAEPGWYPDSAGDDLRRYWDGHVWTGHVWRGRTRERPRKARGRR